MASSTFSITAPCRIRAADGPNSRTRRTAGSSRKAAARIRQGAVIEKVDEAMAAQRIHEVDRARSQYVRRLYNCDINDPELFAVQLDSTALSLDACTDLIVEAYLDFRR